MAAWIIVCCPQSAYKLGLQLSVGIVVKKNPPKPHKGQVFIFSIAGLFSIWKSSSQQPQCIM